MPASEKKYQLRCLAELTQYLRDARDGNAEKAFNAKKRPSGTYRAIPGWKQSTEFPYVCVRVPTGGGKTRMAADSVGIIAKNYLQTDRHLVLWLAPSDAIVQQTLRQLRDRGSPVYRAIAEEFGGQVAVLDIGEALYVTAATLSGACTVIVTTAQAWRVDAKDGRKVYQTDNGALMGHFDNVPNKLLSRLEKGPGGKPAYSLANVLKLRRPIVIIDEGHRFRTKLTFETLKRFDPCAVVEFTATPYVEGAARVPANVLTEASAADLKAEHMIKAPVILKGSKQWPDAVRLAIAKRKELERLCKAEEKSSGHYIRPIVLFQAQDADEKVNTTALVKHLIESQGLPKEEVVEHHGTKKDLPENILSPNCPVRYVVSVDALSEGWDCPFAYVLCTVAQLSSSVAVEQILGRVLRMPYVTPKSDEALNQAYCFTSSGKFEEAASSLKEALVEAGFGKDEAEQMVQEAPREGAERDEPAPLFRGRELPVFIDSKLDDKAKAAIEKAVPGDVRFEATANGSGTTILYKGEPLDERAVAAVAKAISSERDPKAAERFRRVTWGEDASPAMLKMPLDVPGLAVPDKDAHGGYSLFESQHRETNWTLEKCDPKLDAETFDASAPMVKTSVLDIDEDGDAWTDKYRGELRETVLWQDQTGPQTIESLSAWLDREVRDPRVTQTDKRLFIDKALSHLSSGRGLGIQSLVPIRWRLGEALSTRIDHYRIKIENQEFQALFEGIAVVPSEPAPEAAFSFPRKAGVYPALRPYTGTKRYDKHYYGVVGDMNKEEAVCAQYIDSHANVKYWVRNLDRLDYSFWLPLVSGRFFPDFVALLHDDRYAVIEYKGEMLEDDRDELAKHEIGKLWEARSGGRCVFVWATTDKMEADIAAKLGTVNARDLKR